MKSLVYDIWLTQVQGIGLTRLNRVIEACGSAEECFRMSEKGLRAIWGLGEEDVEQLLRSRKRFSAEKALQALEATKTSVLRRDDPRFPPGLKTIPQAPWLLFYRGRLPAPEKPSIAIVGARECSDYGRAMAKLLGKTLAEAGVTVISGLARGIDAASHAGALSGNGETYAVLGCGPDLCYPKSSQNLYSQIVSTGGILSEYAPGTEPAARFFPARNRIISGLSDAVIVVEARIRSGSLITVDHALEQGKDIYAIPGRITDRLSGGTNRLLTQGATPIVSMEDLLKDLRLSTDKFAEKTNAAKKTLDKTETTVYSDIDFVPAGLETLLDTTGLPLPKLLAVLYDLQKKGLIEESFPNQFRRVY